MRKLSKRTIAEIVGGILLIGVGASSASGSSTATEQPTPTPQIIVKSTTIPGPERTVEVTASPQIVEKTVEKEVVPDVCLQALDDADSALKIAADAFGLTRDMFVALQSFDVDTMEEKADALADLAPKMSNASDTYLDSKAACFAAGDQ